MPLPSVTEFLQLADSETTQQARWAADQFHLPNLTVKLKITPHQHSYHGVTQTIWKDGQFDHCEIKLSSFYFLNHEHLAVSEYRRFNHDPLIGGFETNSWQLGLKALIAHEMAHAVQFSLRIAAQQAREGQQTHPLVSGWTDSKPVFIAPYGPYEGHHGLMFQTIYGQLRRQFVNPHISPQQFTAPLVNFHVVDDLAERIAQQPASGLEGLEFVSNGRLVRVVGRNPNGRSYLRGFYITDSTGVLFRIKLALIVARCPRAQEIVDSNAELKTELLTNCQRIIKRSQTNQKISETKQRRKAP